MLHKSVTVKKIQQLDRVAIDQYGIPSLVLMENAGAAVADQVIKAVRNKKNPKVCVVCGIGNNAGDGFVVARHLSDVGIKTRTILMGSGGELSDDAAINYSILKKLKYPVGELKKFSPSITKHIREADCVVDAIFGVGLNREIKEPFNSVITAINHYAKKVISVDIPSGLDGTTGKIHGVCVKADRTVTFSFAKKGFFRSKGVGPSGKIQVVNIGIPNKLKKKICG